MSELKPCPFCGILCEICGESTMTYCAEALADHLLANGVTFETDTDVGCKWIIVEDDMPADVVPVLGHMTDAGDFPAVRECCRFGDNFFFPALLEVHPIDKWMEMPKEDADC